MRRFGWGGFGLRFLFAFALVLASYNPSGYSYYHWLEDTLPDINPYICLAGLVLLIGWVVYLRATVRSLGFLGLLLLGAVFGCVLWMLFDWGWFDPAQGEVVAWLLVLMQAFILAIGISWSHIRRRLTGQVDIDDVDEN